MARKSNVFYLDFEKAKKGNYFVDREEHFKKYGVEGKYKMYVGTPLVRNIDGFYIYENDIPSLITNVMIRGEYLRALAHNKVIIFKWDRR